MDVFEKIRQLVALDVTLQGKVYSEIPLSLRGVTTRSQWMVNTDTATNIDHQAAALATPSFETARVVTVTTVTSEVSEAE
ncbi:hypothetical protein PoB_000532800 [Plakobranchus ocellatus]|uniref:Uncharacterized protein n=1 Tax=Plakobranchus ocellatus TaxID=259542 RepID=A0AAV3Y8Q9_9GAST|nr:hypothetical protein PoB_000532800 [Plakobranchus ocellatus]